MDPNLISLYQQNQHINPSIMVSVLNEHEAGLFRNPMDSCTEEWYDDGMQIEEELKDEGLKYTQTKKIKFESKFDGYEGEY